MPQIECACTYCGKIFYKPAYRIRAGGGRYCSRNCGLQKARLSPKPEPWNKGLTTVTSDKLKKMGKNISSAHKTRFQNGDVTWNKGLTKETDPRVADYVAKQTEFRNTEGEQKDAWRAAMSKGQVKAHAAGKYPHTFTKIEQKTWAYLESLGMTVKKYADRSDSDSDDVWYHQCPVDDIWVADFGRPKRKEVIECNGCYVHGHSADKCQHQTAKYGWSDFSERNNKRDRMKYNYYQRHGWKYALVWECEGEKEDFHRISKYLL